MAIVIIWVSNFLLLSSLISLFSCSRYFPLSSDVFQIFYKYKLFFLALVYLRVHACYLGYPCIQYISSQLFRKLFSSFPLFLFSSPKYHLLTTGQIKNKIYISYQFNCVSHSLESIANKKLNEGKWYKIM